MKRKSLNIGTATIISDRSAVFDQVILDATASRKVRRNKYNNKKTVVDGHTFDSKREAAHYELLKLRQSLGEISNLELQVKFELHVNGVWVANYIADFAYSEDGKKVVCDVKGVKTRAYKIRKRLMLALRGIEIQEVF